jgi:hypothetical protein
MGKVFASTMRLATQVRGAGIVPSIELPPECGLRLPDPVLRGSLPLPNRDRYRERRGERNTDESPRAAAGLHSLTRRNRCGPELHHSSIASSRLVFVEFCTGGRNAIYKPMYEHTGRGVRIIHNQGETLGWVRHTGPGKIRGNVPAILRVFVWNDAFMLEGAGCQFQTHNAVVMHAMWEQPKIENNRMRTRQTGCRSDGPAI